MNFRLNYTLQPCLYDYLMQWAINKVKWYHSFLYNANTLALAAFCLSTDDDTQLPNSREWSIYDALNIVLCRFVWTFKRELWFGLYYSQRWDSHCHIGFSLLSNAYLTYLTFVADCLWQRAFGSLNTEFFLMPHVSYWIYMMMTRWQFPPSLKLIRPFVASL